jgi:hypothetical protein
LWSEHANLDVTSSTNSCELQVGGNGRFEGSRFKAGKILLRCKTVIGGADSTKVAR